MFSLQNKDTCTQTLSITINVFRFNKRKYKQHFSFGNSNLMGIKKYDLIQMVIKRLTMMLIALLYRERSVVYI